MIKEEPKKKNNKTFLQILLEYLRTIVISIVFGVVFTTGLSIHARNEMIKNLHISAAERLKMDVQLARKIIQESDFTKNLANQNYIVCMQVGNLYESALDFEKAQYAYQLATERERKNFYAPYLKLVSVLIRQSKFNEAQDIINSIEDKNNKDLIKFKTRVYIDLGDKYYSDGKYLKASKCYEKAKYYYDKFSKKDKVIDTSIKNRLTQSYVETANVIVKNGYNSDAVKYLKKARTLAPKDYNILYKMAIVYSDLDPQKAVEYFEELMQKIPQKIDYEIYSRALINASNIAELEGNKVKAKYYRYKIYSIDLFIKKKVVYKNDLELELKDFSVKKTFFKYYINSKYILKNVSANDFYKLNLQFVLLQNDKEKETHTVSCVTKNRPLLPGEETSPIEIKLGKNIFTKRELEQYSINIYVYKDEKFKTLLYSYKIADNIN